MDKGVWVLKEKKPDFEPIKDEPTYFNYHVSVSGNSVKGGWSWKDDPVKPECSGEVWGTSSWEEIPSVLQPGIGQNTTLKADVGGSQSCAYRHVSSRTALYVNDGKQGSEASVGYATSDPKPAPVSVKVPWEAPWGKIGDMLTITVVAQVPGAVSNHYYYNYIYTYEAPGSQSKQYTSAMETEPVEQQKPQQEYVPQTNKKPMAYIERIEGEGDVKIDGLVVRSSENRVPVFEGNTIRTGPSTQVVLLFKTGASARMQENTQFNLKKEEFVKGDETAIYGSLWKGIVSFFVPKGASAEKKFEVETNLALTSIKGTIFNITETQESTTVYVVDGTVSVMSKNTGDEALVSAGERIKVTDLGLTKPGRFDPASEKAKWDSFISETESAGTEMSARESETRLSGMEEEANRLAQDGHKLLVKGNEYYEDGSLDEANQSWENANKAFDDAIKIDPLNASHWNGKGSALLNIGRIEEAEEALDKATQLDPRNAMYWNHKGFALHWMGLCDEAAEAYDKAILLDPRRAFIYWSNKAGAFMLCGKYNDAAEASKRSGDHDLDEMIRLYGSEMGFEKLS